MKVKNLFTINPSGSTKQFEGFINYIDTSSVIDGKLITVQYLNDNYPSRAKRVIKKDDILYSTVRPNLRHYYHHVINIDHSVASTGFAVLRNIDDRKADTKFVFYYLTLPYIVNYLDSIAQASQTTYPTFSPKDLGRINLPNIDIITQNKIASILSKYDDLIENNNKRIKILEQMAENLYKEWFVRFRFPGHEQSEFENGIPKGWKYQTVEELSSVLRRGISPTYDSNGKYTVINQKCIRSSILDMSEARRQSKDYKNELNLQDGDTVICSTGTGTLGRVGKVYGNYRNTTYDSHVTLVRSDDKTGKHFLYWSLKALQPWFMNMGIGSTNQQELYRSTIKNAKVLIPYDDKLLDDFEKHIQTIHQQIRVLRDKNQILTRQRDMLLPRLMSGKLKV